MSTFIRKYAFILTIAGLIVTADQITKALIRQSLDFTETWSPWEWLAPYARLVHWRNTGAAFGIFQDSNQVFIVLAFIVSGLILYYYPRVAQDDWTLRLAMSMQLGGAVGNLIDRIVFGYVLDFVSVGTFAVFNIADASISTGVVVLLLGVWIHERKLAQPDQSEPEDESPTEPPAAAELVIPEQDLRRE